MSMLKAIYLNSSVDTKNPPRGASYITYDAQDGFKFWNDDKQYFVNRPVTAFEVMPTTEAIAANTVDDVTGLKFKQEVPAGTVMAFMLRSAVPAKNNDVIIDWGDGCIEEINNNKYEFADKGYQVSHDYAHSMKSSVQRFIVKIYGKDYYTFRTDKANHKNLISRIFDADLPVASHVVNFASMCNKADRLLKVVIPHSSAYMTNAYNLASTFENAVNLVSLTGFEDNVLRANCIISNICKGCTALTETDFQIPVCTPSVAGIFQNCKSLTNQIIPIYPKTGLAVTLTNNSGAFTDVPAVITNTIPDFAGGTMSDAIAAAAE